MKCFALLLVALLAGCATVPQVARVPYDPAYYASLPTTGTGIVHGQLFLRTRGGDVKKGAGEKVILNPVTPISEQWFVRGYQNGERLAPADPRYSAHAITTQADADGNFTFTDVPPGAYYVVGQITWSAPYIGTQGGFVAKKIDVSNGATTRVVLTR